tara:strand:- start:430 stop:1848 length:1419 start_codon:yes stop_codon:yes gene_type:complete
MENNVIFRLSKCLRFCASFPGVVGIVFLIAKLVAPSSANSQSINDALISTYINNPTLLAARVGLTATDEGVPQALSSWRPSVTMSMDYGHSRITNTRNSGSDIDQVRQPKSVALNISQPIYRGGRTLAATSKAENQVAAARARLIGTEQTVLLKAITAFQNVFRDKAVLSLNKNNERVLKRQLEATRDRFQVGEISRTDVHQAEARLAKAVADRIQSEGALEISRANYVNVVGAPVPGNLQEAKLPEGLPKTRDEAIKAAATKNPAVIGAEYDKRAAKDNINSVRGELRPTVTLDAALSRKNESAAESGWTETKSVTLKLSVPIYQNGSVYSRLRAAKQSAAKSTQTIDEGRRNAVEAASKSWDSLVTARARVNAFRTQIDANVVALEGVQREAAVGSRTVLDVLDAEQELLDSRVSYVRAQSDELLTSYELLSSVGGLTARELSLDVELYDPRRYYNSVRDKVIGTSLDGR